jgi:hypothetical protein
MTDKKKRTYQAETLGLPPLKMVLVHAENERANAAAGPSSSAPRRKTKAHKETEEVVLRLIDYIENEMD